jgi:broad specificity phosphatase PhoE
MRLFLARHGETDWNAAHRLQGQADRPLTPRGQAQATALCRLLQRHPITAVYASPLQRARDTAAPLAEALGLEVQEAAAMLEIDYGVLEGHTQQSVAGTDLEDLWRRRSQNPLAFDAPGAETYDDLVERVRPFAASLRRRHAGQTIVVVGHRASNRALLAVLLGRPLSEMVALKQQNDEVVEIRPGEEPELQTHSTRDATSAPGNPQDT